MSVGSDSSLLFRFPAATKASDLQVWNNAAFDDEDGNDGEAKYFHFANSTPTSSWWNQCLDSHASKENLSPVPENSSIRCADGRKEDDQEGQIDREIEEIEKEIARLSTRLNALKLEKAESKMKREAEKRGRMVPAKYMDPNRRGMSMCPAEIMSELRPRTRNKPESGILTPCSKQTRRVSCFWRLQEVDELKEIKERGKSSSLSPKSRKPWPKAEPFPKQAVTTGGAKKPIKKDDGVAALIQPRMLFKEGERPPSSTKKVPKSGRVVASRYHLGDMRKRSLPDDVKEEGSKRRLSSGVNGNSGALVNQNGRVKKKWDVVEPIESNNRTRASDLLPKIRTLRCPNETPRDSGAAKRVADLAGRKSFFSSDDNEDELGGKAAVEEGVGDSIRQVLNFEEEL